MVYKDDSGTCPPTTQREENKMLHPLSRTRCILILALMIFAGGCAGRSGPTAVNPTASGNRIISIDASNYKFKPNDIRAEKPGPFILQVHNTSSGSEHNLTLTDPHGKVVKSVDVRPGQTIISNIELPETGTYRFYCNKRFHSSLGMKGRIVIGGPGK
jgi:plastocyanin